MSLLPTWTLCFPSDFSVHDLSWETWSWSFSRAALTSTILFHVYSMELALWSPPRQLLVLVDSNLRYHVCRLSLSCYSIWLGCPKTNPGTLPIIHIDVKINMAGCSKVLTIASQHLHSTMAIITPRSESCVLVLLIICTAEPFTWYLVLTQLHMLLG